MVSVLHKWMLLFLAPVLLSGTSALPFGKLRVNSVEDKSFSKRHNHPFYVSVVEVAHNKAAATLEISCKLFAEDLETVLERQYKTGVDFGQAGQKEAIDRMVARYIQQHLLLAADGKPLQLNYIGFEQESEALYGYFEASGVAAVKVLRVENNLLYDFTDKQINIMHVTVKGVRKSSKLDYPETQAAFAF